MSCGARRIPAPGSASSGFRGSSPQRGEREAGSGRPPKAALVVARQILRKVLLMSIYVTASSVAPGAWTFTGAAAYDGLLQGAVAHDGVAIVPTRQRPISGSSDAPFNQVRGTEGPLKPPSARKRPGVSRGAPRPCTTPLGLEGPLKPPEVARSAPGNLRRSRFPMWA